MFSRGTQVAQCDAMRWAMLASLLCGGCFVLDATVPDHVNGTAPKTVQQPILPNDIFETLNGPVEAKNELCEQDADHPNFPDDADTLTKVLCQDIKPGAPP